MRKVSVNVGNASSVFGLLEELAPNTVQVLWDSLPVEGQLTHGRWSGSAAWTKTPNQPLADNDGGEVRVSSLYPGFMFIRKGPVGLGEIMLSYGEADARSFTGTGYATPVAMIEGASEDLFAELRRSWTEGALPIQIRRIDA